MNKQTCDFYDIISSVSDEELMKPVKNGVTFKEFVECIPRPELESKILSVDEQRKNLATYAKLMHEHVGFEGFGLENNAKFKQRIVELYQQIQVPMPASDFLYQVIQTAHQYILDRHCIVGTGANWIGSKRAESAQADCGQNLMKSSERPHGYQIVKQKFDENNTPMWEIGTLKQNNKNILLISIASSGYDYSYEYWKEFITTFDSIYEGGQNWDKIILDVRGNVGGEDRAIYHIARRTYGNCLNPYKRCEIKDTPLADYVYQTHGIFSRFNDGVKHCPRRHFSGQNIVLFDETQSYYAFNEKDGFQGEIDVLIDRHNGSAAESAYTLFYHHPKVRYIGENTFGQQQFQQGQIHLPCGFLMRVGVTKLTYWDKEGENIECIGHKPDIVCNGQNALTVALTDNTPAIKHVLNETVKNKIMPSEQTVYNPKESVTRKACSIHYVESALRRIEKNNILREKQQKKAKKSAKQAINIIDKGIIR